MGNLDKIEAVRGLGKALSKLVEKQKDPTWLTDIKIEEHEINPINIIFHALFNRRCAIRFEQAKDSDGNYKDGMEAVHIDNSVHRENVEAILGLARKDELFVMHMESIEGRFRQDGKLLARARQLLGEDECKSLEALDYETLAVAERGLRHHQEADELFAKSKSLGVDPRSPELVEKRVRRIEEVLDRILGERPDLRP